MMTNTEKENVFRVDWNTSNSNDTTRRELTKRHILHMPYISNKGYQKMAVWTDIKEILFPSCDRNCEIVLEELKKFLGYPKSEKYMHPCSPRDHVAFLRQFRYVAIGSLLVQINKIDFSHVLWQKVLKRHISPENDKQFCCSPAIKTNNIPTVTKAASLSVLKLQKIYVDANENTVQSKESFVIPAFMANHGSNEPPDHYIPLHLLGNNVPNVRKALVDFCGRHIVKSDDPDTHCCSVEEARQITIWQFNKLGGWNGLWRHLTTRDLLVSFKSCMQYLEKQCNFLTTIKTSDDSVEIEMKVGINPSKECSKVRDGKSKEAKSESCNDLFPNLQGYYQNHIAPKPVTVGPSPLDCKDKCVLEKKRQRIKSPKEESVVNWKIDWIGGTNEKTNKQLLNENSKTTNTLSSSQASSKFGMPDAKMPKEGKGVAERRRSTGKGSYDHPEIKKKETQKKSLHSTSATVNRKILNEKTTDDETLMKLVSCNPFKHSIEALKAIREMNLEKERRRLSSTPSQTYNATQKNENKNGDPKLVCSGKQIPIAKSVILPMLNFYKMRGKLRATKDQELKKERLELPKRSQDTSSLGNIKAIKEKTSDNSRYNNTKTEVDVNFSKANAEATKPLSIPAVSRSSENKAKHLSCVDNVQKKKTNSPDFSKHEEGIRMMSNRTSAGRRHISSSEISENLTRDVQERVSRSAKSSNRIRDKGLLKSNDQSCKKKPLTTRRVSFEIDEPTIQCIKTEQASSAKEYENMPKGNRKSTERDSRSSDEKPRIQGKQEDSSVIRYVGKYENGEDMRKTDATIEERKDLLDLYSTGDVGDNTFHPKKRWAKHFLDVSSCDVEKSDVGKCDAAAERIPSGKTDEKEQERIKKSDMETKHSSKYSFKTYVPSEQQNSKENYTELFLLKDVNVDHEEVVGEKCLNDICPMAISDLCSSPKKSNSFVEDELKSESSTNTDSPSDDNTITIYVESDQYQPPNKCSTIIDTVEPCDSKLNKPEKDFQISREIINTSEKESQTEDVDVYVDVVNTSDDDVEFLGYASGDTHEVVHMTKKGKKKKKTGNKSIKKKTKSKKGKAKVTKSSCSVDNDTDEISTAIRIQSVIEEQKRILNIITKTKGTELRSSDKTGQRRGKKSVSEKDLRDIELSISRGTSVPTPSQLLETVKQSDDLGRKKGIRIKRGNKEEIKQEGSGIISGEHSDKSVNPAFGIDTFDIGYDVFRDDSGTEIGGLVLHPKFNLPYVLVNGFQYIALADAYKLFPGCKKSCRILKSVLKNEAPLHVTQCTWEELYILDLIYYAKGRRLMTGDPLIRLDPLIGRYEELLCAVYQRHATDTKHKCTYI